MANDGNVKIGVKLDDKGFKEEVSGLGSFAQKGFSAIGSTTVAVAKLAAGAVTAATGAIATGLGVSVKVGAAFEAEMSKVSAISGATGDELSQLTEKAKEMGAATKFSASESAQAMEYMAMAGWKTTDMLSGIEGMAATEAGYLVDALAVKQGFTQLNTNIGKHGTYDKLLSYSGTEQSSYTVSDMSKYRYLHIVEQYADGVSIYRQAFVPIELFRSSCNTGYNSWLSTDRFQLRWISKTQLQATRVSGTTGRALTVYGVY